MTETTNRLFFEDLSVGQRFESGTYTVEADEIRDFASRYDPQDFHLDDEAARHTFFGGLAASGWHTAAITMRLLIDGGLPFAKGLIGANAEIAWPHATRPGDTLSVVTTIAELRPSGSHPDRGWVTVSAETSTATGQIVQKTTGADARVPPLTPGARTRALGRRVEVWARRATARIGRRPPLDCRFAGPVG